MTADDSQAARISLIKRNLDKGRFVVVNETGRCILCRKRGQVRKAYDYGIHVISACQECIDHVKKVS